MILPGDEKELVNISKKISNIHRVFCSLHILHNFGIYTEKSLIHWKIIFKEEGATPGGFKNWSNSTAFSFIKRV